MPKYIFNKRDCRKWVKNPMINPITGKTLNIKAKSGIYNQLKKRCHELKIDIPRKSGKSQVIKKSKSSSKSDQSWIKHRKKLLNI